MIKVICGDALEEMAKLPDHSIQAIITSPPWYDSNGNHDEEAVSTFRRNLFVEFARLLKPNGTVFFDTFRWEIDRTLLGELKESGAVHCNKSTILIATLDGTDMGTDTIDIETSHMKRVNIDGRHCHHTAAFVSEVPYRCMLISSKPGDLVLDPFCGIGTVGIVANKIGRDAILIDYDPNSIFIAKRLTQ